MGFRSDLKIKTALGHAAAAVLAAEPGGLPAGFKEARRQALEVQQMLGLARVPLSGIYREANERALVAARAMVEAANTFESHCAIQGNTFTVDRAVMETCVRQVALAFEFACPT